MGRWVPQRPHLSEELGTCWMKIRHNYLLLARTSSSSGSSEQPIFGILDFCGIQMFCVQDKTEVSWIISVHFFLKWNTIFKDLYEFPLFGFGFPFISDATSTPSHLAHLFFTPIASKKTSNLSEFSPRLKWSDPRQDRPTLHMRLYPGQQSVPPGGGAQDSGGAGDHPPLLGLPGWAS